MNKPVLKLLLLAFAIVAAPFSAMAQDEQLKGEVVSVGENAVTLLLTSSDLAVKEGDWALFSNKISETETEVARGEIFQIVDGSIVVGIQRDWIEVGSEAVILPRAPIHECDEISAIPGDAFSMVEEGVRNEALEVKVAIAACREAIAEFPKEPRFHAQLGRALQVSEKPASAVLSYQRALDVAPDYPVVLHRLAMIRYAGPEELRDFETARKLFTRAAELGYDAAMATLGAMCRDGEGGDVDYKAAAHWFSIAAETGDADSMNALGECFQNGWGSEIDVSQALLWYRSAAELDSSRAMRNLGNAFANGLGVSQNDAKAFEWYRKAALKEDGESLYWIGVFLREGRGTEANFDHSMESLNLAANLGNAKAMRELGRIYYEGTLVKKDYNIAAVWYQKAAKNGDTGAQFNLGIMTEKGLGTERNRQLAIEWYRSAAKKGHTGSQQRLLALKQDW